MLKQLLLVTVVLGYSASVLAAPLKVVATSTSVAALVEEIAGTKVKLTVLAPPDRDLHYLQARPSIIRALRSADLLISVGAELETGWLPLAIASSANPTINPGKPGYFEAAAHVELMDTGIKADRSHGDVHPAGSPHFTLDPIRMATIARALAMRLGELDPTNASHYLLRADTFSEKAQARSNQWIEQSKNASGVALYHRDAIYLLDRLNVPLLGVIEPIAGVPPSNKHLKELIGAFRGKTGSIVTTTYQSPQASEFVAKALDWPLTRLPLDPPMKSDGDAYLDHIDQWVKAILGKREP